jgi:antitoxin (DNA-binding transcriptional repressor) of toxin-antitoxin stability system
MTSRGRPFRRFFSYQLPCVSLVVPNFSPLILFMESCLLILLRCPSHQCTSKRARSIKIIGGEGVAVTATVAKRYDLDHAWCGARPRRRAAWDSKWIHAQFLDRDATYITYTRSMSEKPVPLPYEVQEMTTTEARKHLPELVNMAAYGHVTTVLVRDGRRLARIVPEEDAWVYSPAWQEKLREAEADLAAGRVQRFEDDDEFLGHLDALADEAGG